MPRIALVEEHSGILRKVSCEFGGERLDLVVAAREREHVHGVRRERDGPGDPGLVASLLDRGRHDAAGTDAVAPHHDRLLLAVGVEEHRAERRRVVRSQLEDVAHLDRGLEP